MRRRTGRTGKGQLLVQLLCELHDLFGAVERVPCHCAQLGDQPHRISEAAPGALGRLVDHRFQLLRGLQAVVHPVEPGTHGDQAVRQVNGLFQALNADVGRNKAFQTLRQLIR